MTRTLLKTLLLTVPAAVALTGCKSGSFSLPLFSSFQKGDGLVQVDEVVSRIEAVHLQTGNPGRLQGCVPLGVMKIRRHGDHGTVHGLTDSLLGNTLQLLRFERRLGAFLLNFENLAYIVL